MSQPPLSEQIYQLEEELGTRLLERDRTRGVRLTTAGTVLLVEARRILSQVEKAIEIVSRADKGEVGTINVSLAPAMASGIVPQMLNHFRRASPGIALQVSEMLTPFQEKCLLDGSVDVGFCYGPLESDRLQTQCVYREPFIVAVPDDHPIAKRQVVNLCELQEVPFIGIPRAISPGLFDLMFLTCREAGLVPAIAQEATQFQTAIGFVSVGMGAALVPSTMAALKRHGVAYVKLDGAEPIIETLIARPRGDNNSAVERFAAIAASFAEENKGSDPLYGFRV
jgi:DNA-binding transcriptional LysR family regulator